MMSRRHSFLRSRAAVSLLLPLLLLLLGLGSRPNCRGAGGRSARVSAVETDSDASQRAAAADDDDDDDDDAPSDDDAIVGDSTGGSGEGGEEEEEEEECGCYSPPPGSTTTTKGGARLAYLITAHNARTIDDASYLFRAIRYPSTIIIVHIDNRTDEGVYLNSTLRREIESCPCGSDVHVDRLFEPEWGEWSMNDPTHWAMDVLVSHPRFRDKWDVFLNLSGDTMPVLTPDVLSELFDPDGGPLAGSNYVTSSNCETGFVPTSVWQFPEKWHKRVHYVHSPDGDYVGDTIIEHVDLDGVARNTTMTTHFGSQWMALTADFVRYLVSELRREESLASMYRDDTIELARLMTDETYIATMLMNVRPYNDTLPELLPGGNLASLPSMYAMRYERMDEHYPTAFGLVPVQQRYDVPNASLCDKPRPWGPYFLGVYDLANIRRSGALFVRKVSVHLDPNIVHMLPVRSHDDLPDIQWPDEVKISEKVDWGMLRAQAREKAKAKEARRAKMKLEKEEEDQGEEEEGEEGDDELDPEVDDDEVEPEPEEK